jgi:hypothetical protein
MIATASAVLTILFFTRGLGARRPLRLRFVGEEEVDDESWIWSSDMSAARARKPGISTELDSPARAGNAARSSSPRGRREQQGSIARPRR